MSEKEKLARELFKSGYNCAQSVFGAFSEDFGIDKETALKLSSSFGGGMGRMREVCGAVSAMFMIAGLKCGYSSNDDKMEKTQHYKRIQNLAKIFKDKNGSIICRELLHLENDGYVPADRTQKYYETRPCEEYVAYAVRILEENIL